MSQRLRCYLESVPGSLAKSRIVVVVIFMCIWFSAADGATNRSSMELVEVSPEGRSFVEHDSGRPYIPFGTNYYDRHTSCIKLI